MQTSQPTDEQIAEQVQGGSTDSFGILVERYRGKLMRYGNRLLFNRTDVEDVVQEIFIKAYRNFQSYDPARKFSAWIYRIAHNEFVNHGKKFSRQLIDYFDFEVLLPRQPIVNSPEKDLDNLQLKQALDSSLEKLKPKYREALVLYFLESLDYKEIADVLRVPISTVGVRIMRGKEQLKKYFKQDI